MYAARCGPYDCSVVDVIERGFRDAARRSMERVDDTVVTLESQLASKLACLDAALEGIQGIHGIRDKEETERLEEEIRTLRARIKKERRIAEARRERTMADAVESRSAAEGMAEFLFEPGYYPDVWQGRETLVPDGVPRCPSHSSGHS